MFRFTVGRIGGYDGIPVLVSRTGYTGELGYEVFCHPKDAPAVWDAIMAAGEAHGIAPLGFDALDMVRDRGRALSSAAMSFDSHTDPFEAGIGFTVPTKKEEDYIGKAAIERRRRTRSSGWSVSRSRATRRPAHGDPVFVGRAQIGMSPAPCARRC